MNRGKLKVYRCSWVIQLDAAGTPTNEACGLYFDGDPVYSDGSPRVFADDASHDECHHRWPLDVAQEICERYNSYEPTSHQKG